MNYSFLEVYLLKELTWTFPKQNDFQQEGQSMFIQTVKYSCLIASGKLNYFQEKKKKKFKLFTTVTRAWLSVKISADLLAGRL